MTSRERFLAACNCQELERPPLWIMRQAGRYLPEYRALKSRFSFLEMVRTPELATEVTLQPLRRFSLDAAILFSDILVIPEALGQAYRFREEGGISMDFALDSREQIERLRGPDAVPEKLGYVFEALSMIKRELSYQKALLGFGGSPWTLAAYMVEGGSSDCFLKIKELFYRDRPSFDLLMDRLTAALIAYFQEQIRAGVDAIQIFDSWGGIVAGTDYEDASLKWIRKIVEALPPHFPVILYAKGAAGQLADQSFTGAKILSVDWTTNLRRVREQLPDTVAVQGNLDPAILNMDPGIVKTETEKLLTLMAGARGHIFNLGHGILPQAKIESVETMVDIVVSWRSR